MTVTVKNNPYNIKHIEESIISLDKVNQSKALETGNVSSDKDVYADVLKYAHSTFDKSVFKIIGRPFITLDGELSQITSSDYLSTFKTVDFSQPLIEINYSFLATSDTNYVGLLGIADSSKTDKFIIGVEPQNKRIVYGIGSITGSFWNKYGQVKIQTNTQYYVKILITNSTTIKCFLSIDKIKWQEDISGSVETPLDLADVLRFGLDRSGTRPLLGSIYLSEFNVKYNNFIYISGNKTGLDVIKSDNYEVVGSPVITDDGIASGFSKSNYVLTREIDLTNHNTWNCTIKINTNDVSSLQFLGGFGNSASFGMSTNINTNGTLSLYLSTNGTQWDLADGVKSTLALSEKTEYYLKRSFDGQNYKVDVSTDNKSWTNYITFKSSTKINQSKLKACLGNFVNLNNPFNGTIDLNACKFEIDGNLIYQPCLKIPYTLSKTGSKIVDAAYRDRVKDVYEKYGTALYYTIDEETPNFTLPMGEVYGMLTKNRDILDIVYPVGRPIQEVNNQLLENEIWLEGAIVSRTDYAHLFDIYGTTFGEGDGNSTFQLPDLRNRVLWGSPDGSNGYIEAALPNIKGTFGNFDTYGSVGNGCFSISSWSQPKCRHDWSGSASSVNMDASRASAVYKDNQTIVQPPAFKIRWKTRFE